MTKINKEQKEEMSRLRSEGVMIRTISKKLGIAESSVQYHTNKKYHDNQILSSKNKARSKTREQRIIDYKKKYAYNKAYLKNKYHDDEAFRKKHIQRVINSQRKRKNKI